MDLYKQQILDHYKNPRNFGQIKNPDVKIEEANSSCGDKLELSLRIKQTTIKDVKFKGQGCAISIATASLLTEQIKGKKLKEVECLDKDDLFKLLTIKVNPGRVSCATLALQAVKKSIKQYKEKVNLIKKAV